MDVHDRARSQESAPVHVAPLRPMRVILGEEVVELGGLVVEGAVGCRASRVRMRSRREADERQRLRKRKKSGRAKHGGKAGVAYGRSSTARAGPGSGTRSTREEEAEEEQGEEEEQAAKSTEEGDAEGSARS